MPHVTDRWPPESSILRRGDVVTAPNRRPDIQGLRAVAVIAVVLFHGGAIFAGGFVGVDIFFTISGFVITGLLLREFSSEGRIRLRKFYRRRILRLLPASALVTITTLALSGLLLNQLTTQEEAGKAAIAATLFCSNLYFAVFTGGYFQPESANNPFLHTWSLSVEEQFYLAFPTILIFAILKTRRLPVARLIGLLVLLGSMSLASCVWLTYGPFPTAGGRLMARIEDFSGSLAFFSPVTRAWEFALGAIIQLLTFRSSPARSAPSFWHLLEASSATILGLCILALPEAGFPGLSALLPTLATAGLILSYSRSTSSPSALRVVLTSRPAVWIGDRSYAWYLWHWPMVVFSMALNEGNRGAAFVGAILALPLAALSYRYLEHPIHTGEKFTRPRNFALVASLSVAAPLAFGFLFTDGARRAWGDDQVAAWKRQIAEQHLDRTSGCFGSWPIGDPARAHCVWRAPHPRGRILLIGDSHAGHLSEPVVAAGNAAGYDVEVATYGNCPLVERLNQPSQACAGYVATSLAYLRQHGSKFAGFILSNASTGYVESAASAKDMDDPAAELPYARQWASDISRTASMLNKVAPTLVLLDTPGAPQMHDCLGSRFTSSIAQCIQYPNDSPVVRRRDQTVREEISALVRAEISVFDPRPFVCNDMGCSGLLPDGSLKYSDSNHLSVAAARGLEAPIHAAITEAFSKR